MLKKSDVVKYRAIPIQRTGNGVSLAIYDPTVIKDKVRIQTALQQQVNFILTNLSSWKKIFDNVEETVEELLKNIKVITTESEDKKDKEEDDIKEKDIGYDVINIVNRILVDAYSKGVSDIHMEPYQNTFRVRFRIDGVLQEIKGQSKKNMLAIISRIKIMSQMDISEKRKPQDGRIKLKIGDNEIDYRVSSLPILYGEKIVLRLLDQSNLQIDMSKLGLEEEQIKRLRNGINSPYGMCLVTGPTGSGKTTTLYSALKELNRISHNISTIEDPVEFNFEGINQVNVKSEAGVTFPTALRAFLRQDPDIIMVGEIRDLEVGEIAVEAALTGHLVLSTLHTNDAPSTVSRLLNMGIEPFLVVGSLNVVVAQRLCRKICPNCREEEEVSPSLLVSTGFSVSSVKRIKVYKGKGCDICNNTGYKGRVAIYETMIMTPKTRELVLRNAPPDDLKKQAIKDGMKTLRMSALTKVVEGLTTLDEAVKNSASDKF